jgi:hypothetical protein
MKFKSESINKKVKDHQKKGQLHDIKYLDLIKIHNLYLKHFSTWHYLTLHNDELHDLYSSPNIVRAIKSRRMRWAGHVARMGEGIDVYRVLVGRPEGKRPLGRPRRTCENHIKLDLKEIGIDGANWIRLARDRVQWRAFVNTVTNLRVP